MTQKEKAIECLRQLNVLGSDVFIKEDKVIVFDSYMGGNVAFYSGLAEMIAEVEKEYGCLVYAVTHEHFVFGECFSMLIVSKYEEDWPHSLRGDNSNSFMAFSWVWNKTHEDCSEFGYVMLQSGFGGILRIG